MSQQFPSVVFEESEWGERQVFSSPKSSNLMDLCDEVGAPVPFSCRGASCSTCRVEILEGLEWVQAPNAFESDLVQGYKTPPQIRFACQIEMRSLTDPHLKATPSSVPQLRVRALGPLD